ncbi:MAG: hypothetical protein KF805_07060 [Phycisphaeraceae bacterium]|nr:hypothetical protein [Phycisphaeraceae bacterium]
MNSQFVPKVSRTGDRSRNSRTSSTTRVLLACAGLAVLAPLAIAGGGRGGGGGNWGGGNGGTRWGVSVGVASGGTFVGGSYSNGFYGGGGRGYCAPVRPFCGPVVRPYCPPAFYGRPAYVGGFYSGYRSYCAPVVAPCVPAYLPPVYVAPSSYVVNQPSVSVGLGIAGSNGGGFFSYSSSPVVTTSYSAPVYAAAQPVVYSPPSQVVTFVNPNPTIVETSAPQAQVAQQSAPPAQQQGPATVFRSGGASGALDRAQTPTSIISVVKAESGDARADAAESFLGRTPSQAWPVTFEGIQEVGGVKEIRCRTIDSLSSGYKPTIIVRGAGDSNMPPRQARGFVTGRVAAISVDDPAYPGGLIVIDDSWIKW